MGAMLAELAVAALFGPYEDQRIEGWTVRIERAALADPDWPAARRLLTDHLFRITRKLPAESLAKTRKVVVWVHQESEWTRCMAYHPSSQWLSENGLNPKMAGGIEVGNLDAFLSWTQQQPWMVLHELAHAYHHLELPQGFQNPKVLAAYNAAMQAGIYEEVRHWNGGTTKHYATTNQQEYFAEATEAYFGANDFFPFVRAELQHHDPEGLKLMQEIWR